MKFGIVSRMANNIFPYHGWPTVCRDDDGVLYVGASAFRLGHLCGFGKNVLFVSRNEGESWSCPKIFNDDALDDRDVGLCYLGEKKILATWFAHPYTHYKTQRLVDWAANLPTPVNTLAKSIVDVWDSLPEDMVDHHGAFCRVSEDGGETWGEVIRTPVSSPHGPTRLSNGKLFYLGKDRKKDRLVLRTGMISAYESSDEGKSWTYLSTVNFNNGCTEVNIHEPYAIELPDGTILGIIRAQGEEIADALGDMNDELKQNKFTMFKTFSHDGGKSWSDPEPMGFLGAPPHLLRHSSGTVILTYSRRKVGTQGIFARVSHDNGKTFGNETLIGPEAYIWDQGYPSTVELDDGSLITVYYQRYENDSFCSLLYTKWTLDELNA